MTESFSVEQTRHVGAMDLVDENGTRVHCDLVLFEEWKEKLSKIFKKS